MDDSDGVPVVKDEKAEDVFDLILEKIKETNLDIPENVIDRAHRIGRELTEEREGKKSSLSQLLLGLQPSATVQYSVGIENELKELE